MQATRYNWLARILHWMSAAVILWATFSGFFIATLDQDSTVKAMLSYFNVSLTTAYTPFFFLRVFNKLRSLAPPLYGVPRSQHVAAKTMHVLLYAVTAVVLGSGLLMMEDDIPVFDLVRVPRLLDNEHWNDVAYRVHRYSCMALFLLVAGHVGAVVAHHRAGRDVLWRMRGRGNPRLRRACE